MKNRLLSAVAAAQRLQLALNHLFEYQNLDEYEEDFDLVFALLEEVRNECYPPLEDRARQQGR